MAKKQSFGMNMGLVAGAGAVARAEGAGNLAGAQALQKVGSFLAHGIGNVVQSRNREFNRLLADQMNKPGLSSEERDKLYKDIEKQRGRYVYLNERRLRLKEEDKLREKATDIVIDKTSKDDVVDALNKNKGDDNKNLNPNDMNNASNFIKNGLVDNNGTKGLVVAKNMYEFDSEDDGVQRAYLDQLTQMIQNPDTFFNDASNLQDGTIPKHIIENARNKYTEKGTMSFEDLPEEIRNDYDFVTQGEFIDIINSRGFNEEAYMQYNASIEQLIADAKNVKSPDQINFRYKKIVDQNKTFIASGNLNQLSNHPIGPGARVFREDLFEGLINNTYKDLGIELTDQQIKDLDPTKDTNVTNEDARKIVNEVLNNKDNKALHAMLFNGFLNNISTQAYIGSLDPNVLSTSTNNNPITFFDEEQAKIKLQEIENQKKSYQGSQGDEPVFNPNKGIDQFNVNQNKNQEPYTTNYTEINNLSIKNTGSGSADILENGNQIEMNVDQLGLVKVNGVKASNNKIIVDSSIAPNLPFGEFRLEGDNYKFYPAQEKMMNKNLMQHFDDKATQQQKEAFEAFIKAVETDRKYADALLNHIQSGQGTISAGTLKNIT
tara:strand:+ start:12256 stop:14067 length:1812 start_codon:yes stop_codon:yes gene_type:complete